MAATWAMCSVQKAGPAEDGTIYIALSDVAGKFGGWFSATPAVKSEMLATALTAISTGKLVNVALTDTVEYSVISRLYLTA